MSSIKVLGPNGEITVHGSTDVPTDVRYSLPASPIQFAVGRPRDPEPPEHLELTLTSLTAAEELIGLLQVAARKLMLGQPKAITIVQGRLVPHGSR